MKTNLDIEVILKRLSTALNVSNDEQLAEKLGVAKATVATWRKRNKIPYDHIVNAASKNLISIDSIVFGDSLPSSESKIVDWAKSISDIDLAKEVFHLLDEEFFLTEEGLNDESIGLIMSAMHNAKRKLPAGFFKANSDEDALIVKNSVYGYINTYHEILHIAKNKTSK